MSQDKERNKLYKEYGGYSTIEKAKGLVNNEDFKNYFNTLKKYSLLREYERTGFPVEKIVNHKKFQILTAEDIYRIMKTKTDKIYTVIGGSEDEILLGEDAEEQIDEYLDEPDIGLSFPWELLNYYLRGFRQGEFIVESMLSNQGKTRKMINLASYLSLTNDIPVLILSNEMTGKKIKACLITTIINNKRYKEFLNIDETFYKTEREIVTGKYRDDTTKEFILRNKGESKQDFIKRLYSNSSEYRNIKQVAKFIREKTKIYFKYLKEYSDTDLEMEIKRNVLGKKVQYVFYDTLKGYRSDDWSIVKQTATKLSEIAAELNVGIYSNYQMTDDSHFIEIFDFNSNNLANSKQVFHVLDTLIFSTALKKEDYYRYSIIDNWGGELPLDINKRYYGSKIAKSRTEGKDKVLILEVDLNYNTWVELGYLTKTETQPSNNKKKYKQKE